MDDRPARRPRASTRPSSPASARSNALTRRATIISCGTRSKSLDAPGDCFDVLKHGMWSMTLRWTITALLLVSMHAGWAAGIGGVKVSWQEDVVLADGRVLPVERTLTFGADEWGRAGRGPLKAQSISFKAGGGMIRWNNEDPWPIPYKPDTLDIVDGEPVVVLPVYRWGPCLKYGFPQEGLVAFRYRGKQWARVPIADLPRSLKVNLLRSTPAAQHSREFKNKRIDSAAKQQLDLNSWGPRQGALIDESVKFYADGEDSCARIRPAPDRELEAARQRNTEAEQNARKVQGAVLSIATEPIDVTRADVAQAKGVWTGVGWLTDSCKGIVQRVEAVRQWSGDAQQHRSTLVGYQLVLAQAPPNKGRIQIQNLVYSQLESMVCRNNTIFAVRRPDKETLIIHRFSYSGQLIDATRVGLPDIGKIIPGKDWGTVWTVVPGNAGLTISLADYVYTRTMDEGGTIRKRITYSIGFAAK